MSEAATEAATAGATAATTADAGPATPAVRRTPARPVLSIALVMFVPAVVLVLDGNLSVQTALVRFVAALLVELGGGPAGLGDRAGGHVGGRGGWR